MPPAEDAETIDPAVLNEYREMAGDGGADFVALLIDRYLTDAPGLVTQIRDSVERADVPALRLAAHSLKSASRTVGARRLAGLSEEAETIARNGTCAGAASIVVALDAEFARVLPVLRRQS